MMIAGWNVDGLKPDRLAAAATLFDELGLTAAVFVETWLPTEHDLPAHMPNFKFLSSRAVRDGRAGRFSGGITLMVRASTPARELAREPRAPSPHWVLWRVSDDLVVAGVYLQPAVSMKLPQYRCVLAGLGNAIEQHVASGDRLLVMGDLNAHLGSLTGDQACPRRQPVLDFLARCSLDLLNQGLSGDPTRWTYEAHYRGRSVVDLVMTRGLADARLRVTPAPVPTSHRLLVVTTDAPAAVADDPDRYAWSRVKFADPDERLMIATLLQPAFDYLHGLWLDAAADLDAIAEAPEQDLQTAVDSLYEHSLEVLRATLEDVAVWPRRTANRGHVSSLQPNWSALQRAPLRFFLRACRRIFTQAAALKPSSRPSIDEFADHWDDVFRQPDAHDGPRYRSVRRPSDLSDDERAMFAESKVAAVISKHDWMKGIGPDNLPMDLLKADGNAAAPWVSAMFVCLYTAQLVPSTWRSAFVMPLHKANTDPAMATNWRGIALQAHLRKAFEACLFQHMHDAGYLDMHPLQFGFRRGVGVPEAIWCADELTSYYDHAKRPLTVVLLDMRKAYDSARRRLVYDKLIGRGVPLVIVAVIQALFDDCGFIITLDGQRSRRIPALVGLFQGAIGSPDLFNVLIDDLPAELVDKFGKCCPRLADEPFPCQLYADDTTLHAFDEDTAQAMADHCQVYADRHQMAWNADKSIVSRPADRPKTRDIVIAGRAMTEESDLGKTNRLLGVVMKQGRLQHAEQLRDRMARAESAMVGIAKSGVFATNCLSLVRKARVASAWVRSRAEYGMSFCRHTAQSLNKFDSLQRSMCVLFFGGRRVRRGNILVMRYVGIAPGQARQAKIRTSFVVKQIERVEQIKEGEPVPFLAKVTRWAMQPQPARSARRKPYQSRLSYMVDKCRVHADALAIWDNGASERDRRAQLECADRDAGRPVQRRHRLPTRQDALLQSLEMHTWTAHEAKSKLMRMQMQPFNLPFPAAYHAGDYARNVASWMTNRIPGSNSPCQGCPERRPLSRYHVNRCIGAMDRLESIVDWRVRAAHYDKADPGVALDMIAVQLNDPARLFPPAPPIAADRRLVPRRMPNPRAPTYRLSDEQRRWMNATGIVVEAARAWCLHGEPIAISAQGLASFGGHAALDNDPLLNDPDNQAARTAVRLAERLMMEQQECNDEDAAQQVDDDDEHDDGAGIDQVGGRDERAKETLEHSKVTAAAGRDRDGGRDARDDDPEVLEQQQQQPEAMNAIGIDRDDGRDARANVQDGARDAQAARPVGSGRDRAGTRPSRPTQSSGILHQGHRQQARQAEARGATYLLARAIALDVVARCVAAAGSTYAPGDTVTELAAPTVPGNDVAVSPPRCIIDVRKPTAPSSPRWHPP